MAEVKLTITGSVPSKKNSRINVARDSRLMSFPNQAYRKWEMNAIRELYTQASKQSLVALTVYPVQVTCKFYVKDKVGRDIDNMLASIMDVLKTHKKKGVILREGILADDSWQHVNPLIGVVAGIDKTNPRVEVEITWPISSL